MTLFLAILCYCLSKPFQARVNGAAFLKGARLYDWPNYPPIYWANTSNLYILKSYQFKLYVILDIVITSEAQQRSTPSQTSIHKLTAGEGME